MVSRCSRSIFRWRKSHGGGGSNSLSDILEKKGEREERELSLQLVSTLGGGGREED